MITLDVSFAPPGLLGAWRPRSCHLVLDVPGAPRLGARVAARVRLEGAALGATVLGSVASVLRDGPRHRVEFAPDPLGLPAVRLLVAAAGGEAVAFRDRAPRLLARLPAVLRSAPRPVYMDTVSVSGDGCGLRWSGPLPAPGQPLALRLGAGPFASHLEGAVRWVADGPARAVVGVAFAVGASPVGWLRWLELLQDAGAPLL